MAHRPPNTTTVRRQYMGAPNQNVWDVSQQDFPESAAIETQLRFLLRFAILAPSPKNSQPWAFSVRDNKVFVALA
jgi:hypothetical protein